MDARLQSVVDPDARMVNNIGTRENPIYESRIVNLTTDKIGYLKVISLKQNGEKVSYSVEGTVLEVSLKNPIQPGENVIFEMVFQGQVPELIRRAGRDSRNGYALSMAQWYPKIAEYDFQGWHADPYIGREFHSPWGNFNVTINIDKKYTVAGTGYNKTNIMGDNPYRPVMFARRGKKSWNFIAPNVHDFTWAADTDYAHQQLLADDGTTLNFYFKNNPDILENWTNLQPKTAEILKYFNLKYF